MTEEEIKRFGTTDGIEINSVYEDIFGLFVYNEEIVVGHIKRFVKIVDKTENSLEYKELIGRGYRSWIEMKVWNWKDKEVSEEFLNRSFIDQKVKSEARKNINNKLKETNGLRFIKVKADI